MYQFKKPANLNGAELLNELKAAGINLDPITEVPLIDGNGNFWLNVEEKDIGLAKSVVESHNGTVVASDISIEKKLESVGLNLSDLKSALGIN